MSKKKKKNQARRNDIERLIAIIAQDMGEGLFGRTEAYVERVGELFTAATDALTKLASGTDFDPATDVFSFSDSKRMSEKSAAILRGLYSAVYNEVKSAVITEWGNANSATDRLIAAALGNDVKDDKRFARLFARNREAVDSFFSRKSEYGGLNLSQRVWKYTGQFKEEMELALSASLGRGDSAATVSRKVRQYLQEPDRLFRRVRDEEGNLKLSKRAAAYHPGRGEYRSSYKNAMRMTRTEVNAAYRAADCDRWSQIDFIVGVEVKRSNHPFACSVCEALAGKYPKDFKFVGWHPQCRCYIVPVMADYDQRMAYHKAVLDGEDVSGWKFDGEIAEPHEGFQKWMKDNADRVEKAAEKGTLPYWMKDNQKYLNVDSQSRRLTDEERRRCKEIREEAKQVLAGQTMTAPNFGSQMRISNGGIKEWINQPHKHYMEKNEMLLNLPDVLAQSTYKGAGVDRHNTSIPIHLFETSIKGDASWIIARDIRGEGILVYSISDSEDILKALHRQ